MGHLIIWVLFNTNLHTLKKLSNLVLTIHFALRRMINRVLPNNTQPSLELLGFTHTSLKRFLLEILFSSYCCERFWFILELTFSPSLFKRPLLRYYGLCWLLYVQWCLTASVTIVRWHAIQISPGKLVLFPLMYLPKYTKLAFGDLGLCLVLQIHPTNLVSNWVRVPQVKRLPPASFRFHLAVDTLALG